jgi:hypothetical protein
MKKTNTSNPLKFFNDNKDMAYKKAGGEMSKYKKSLKRFQGDVTGSQVGPMTQEQAANAAFASPQNDPAIPPIPYANPTPVMNSSRPTGINPIDAMGDDTQRMNNMDKGQYNSSGTMQARSAAYQKKGGSVKKKYDEGGETDPRNKKYNKFKGDPTSTVSKIGDKSIKFDTSNAGKTYTKTTYKKVSANRAQNASPEKRWGDDEIKKTKTISGNAATRQANRLAKKIENQPGTYQKMGGITKTTVVNRISGVKKNASKKK